jgi:hypothetical protein
MVAEPNLVESFERYIASLWKTPHNNDSDSFVTCERSFKTLTDEVKLLMHLRG